MWISGTPWRPRRARHPPDCGKCGKDDRIPLGRVKVSRGAQILPARSESISHSDKPLGMAREVLSEAQTKWRATGHAGKHFGQRSFLCAPLHFSPFAYSQALRPFLQPSPDHRFMTERRPECRPPPDYSRVRRYSAERRQGYFFTRLVWLATHCQRSPFMIQVSVKRP